MDQHARRRRCDCYCGGEDDRRVFEIVPSLANATLHRYIKDLTYVRMELAALQTAEEDAAVKQLEMRVGRSRRWRQVG